MAIFIGTGKNQVPTNGDLGSLAYQNQNEVEIDNGRAALDEYQKTFSAPKIKPSLNLNFAKMESFDKKVSFTRASEAYAYEGVSAKAEENLVLYSEQFDNAYWGKAAVTVLPNQTLAPNGTTTADLVAETTGNSVHLVQSSGFSAIAATQYVNSFYVKRGGGVTAPDWVQLTFSGSSFPAVNYANFNITTGALGNVVGGVASITLSPNGFYRISFAVISNVNGSGTLNTVNLAFTNNQDAIEKTPIYAGQTTSDVFIWGAQLEQRDTLTDYQRTTDRIVQKYVDTYTRLDSDKPRFREIDPVTKQRKGLLIEEARTNLVLYSNDFNNLGWTKTQSSIALGVASPVGTGYKLISNTVNAEHRISRQDVSVTTGQTYTVSAYVKPAELHRVRLLLAGQVDGYDFNLLNETATLVGSASNPVIQKLSNGWYRISCAVVASGSPRGVNIGQLDLINDGYSGFYISQAQLEVGSFATSPIVTLGSTVTRALENAQINNIVGIYENSEGALYADINNAFYRNGVTNYVVGFNRVGGGGFFGFSSVSRDIRTTYGNVIDQDSVLTVDGFFSARVAASQDTEVLTYARNGKIIDTLKVQTPNLNNLDFFQISIVNGKIEVPFVAYYPQALTAEELAFLTRNTQEDI